MNRRFFNFVLAALAAASLLGSGARAQQQQANASAVPSAASGAVDVQRIVTGFTAREAQFRQALAQYSFKRSAIIQTLGLGGQITGEYRRESRFVADDSGKLYEKITYFPMPTLTEITISAEDLEDLGGVAPFALEASKAHLYNFNYVGKERLDEIDTYVFDVSPKADVNNPRIAKQLFKEKQRFFLGRIWVDQQDLQIVKSRGKGVPETKEAKYPVFESYREQIDGRYWFPTYLYSEDELVFGNGQIVRIRAKVRFTDYERLSGKVRIAEEGEPGAEDATTRPTTQPTPTPAPTPKP
ncbi:MAG TPA: hypothetical protein VER08_01000 [Pyrinomonadaceae bacterium]|nr:hypothetical protein [Pyrinomonadaceae bacterium]